MTKYKVLCYTIVDTAGISIPIYGWEEDGEFDTEEEAKQYVKERKALHPDDRYSIEEIQ